MKRLFLLGMLLITGWCMHAAQLTESEAYRIAQKYNRSLAATPWKQKAPGTVEVAPDAEYYVFNASQNQGYVIVSGEDSLTELVGYSDSGTIDMDNLPDNLSSWLEAYAEYVKAVRRSEAEPFKNNLLASYPTIRPLLGEIQWNQSMPYNDMCPYDSEAGERCPSGCVATALAQIMKYWEWPVNGVGSYSYTSNYGVLSADFTKTYQWDKMRDIYNAYYDADWNIIKEWTQEEGDAVAQLMADLGVALEMGYAPGGSGSNDIMVERAMRNHFRYEVENHPRLSMASSEFVDLLVTELRQSRPVYFSGGSASGTGHAFVVDGCNSDGYFHVNWGWGGMSNGYFNVNYMNPNEQGIGGSDGGYFMRQSATTLKPYRDGDVAPVGQVVFSYTTSQSNQITGLVANVESFSKDEPMDFTVYGLWNSSSRDFYGNVRACVKNEAGDVVAESGNYLEIAGLEAGYLFAEIGLMYYSPDFSQLADGRYTLSLQSCENGYEGEWVDFQSRSFITFEVSGDQVTVIPDELKLEMNAPMEGPSEVYTDESMTIKCVVENVGDIAAVGALRLKIYSASDDAYIGYMDNDVMIYDGVDFETTFAFSLAQYFTVGTSYYCTLCFVDSSNNEVPIDTDLEPFRFTVMEGNAPRKQLAFGYYDTADSKGGITVENSKIFSGWSQNVMIHNLTNYNKEAMTADVGIALFDEASSLYKICNYRTVGLNSKTYTSECEIAAGFCSLDGYEDGAYYFEAMSREQYEGMSYDWIHFQQTSRIYVQKYGDWVYVYDPENYLKVNGITFSNAPIQDANVSVAVDLENYAYTAASGSLEYRVYEKDYSNNPLVSGTVDVNVEAESVVDIPLELNGSQFVIGKEYELEISGYVDNADSEKTFIGKTLPFVVLDPSGVGSMAVASSVYPNPAVDRITVTAASPVVSVDLFSVDGRKMQTATANGQTSLTMDLSQMPSGVYVVIVRTENGMERHRVIKK